MKPVIAKSLQVQQDCLSLEDLVVTAGSVDVDVGASRVDIPLVTEGDGDIRGRQQLDLVSSEYSTPEVWRQTEQILDIVPRIWRGRCRNR